LYASINVFFFQDKTKSSIKPPQTRTKKLIKGKRFFCSSSEKNRTAIDHALDSFSRQRTVGNSRVNKFSLLCSWCLFDRRAHFEERAGSESERERHFAASLLPRDWKEKRIRRTLGRRS
jgi:hypothetical protein